MPNYVVKGNNGVIIHYDYYKAQQCQRYIRKSMIKKYEVFEEAEAAALEHLEDIVPYYIPIPEHLEVNEMVTIAKLVRAEKKRREKNE